MHIGFTFDLRAEYLARGYQEEETAEFDQQGTIDAVARSIESLGHSVDRIGSAQALIGRLARGDRWDLVFNLADDFLRRLSLPPPFADEREDTFCRNQ